jgi:hypothetical protein
MSEAHTKHTQASSASSVSKRNSILRGSLGMYWLRQSQDMHTIAMRHKRLWHGTPRKSGAAMRRTC